MSAWTIFERLSSLTTALIQTGKFNSLSYMEILKEHSLKMIRLRLVFSLTINFFFLCRT